MKRSYSQTGEDLIIKSLLEQLKIDKPSFIDLGAHHPYKLNNTALFYENGARGLNVEADPSLVKEFNNLRGEDTNLNVGVGVKKEKLTFYIMSTPTLNTFSLDEVERYKNVGDFFLKEKILIDVLPYHEVVAMYFNNKSPDLLNLDVEGMDFEIIKSIDFSIHRPKIICVETITFDRPGKGQKDDELISYIENRDYLLYADTRINSIFVDKKHYF